MTDWSVGFETGGGTAEGVRESLCTLGNGYLGTRGAVPERRAGAYPGTYLAGCYNRLSDTVHPAGTTRATVVENEGLVNAPNWLPLTLRMADGAWLGSPGARVAGERHELDLLRGLLVRHFWLSDESGRTARVTQRRIVHRRWPHVCALQTTVTPVGWSGPLTVRSTVDTGVTNAGVPRYAGLSGRHLAPAERAERIGPDTVLCVAETDQSGIRIALAARTRAPAADRRDRRERGEFGEELVLDAVDGAPVVVEKVVAVYTSRDPAISAPEEAAAGLVGELPDFDELLDAHALAWAQEWQRFHIDVTARDVPAGDVGALPVLRLHLFHVLQTLSTHSADLDVGVPARGLHGEAYRGHVLWDELFVLPVLSLRMPEVARGLLLYRYRRLPAARRAARAQGRRGALFPWQSGSSGREENQRLHLNPRSGRWVEDRTDRQRHVGLAVAYNTWQYYQATGDRAFLDEHGAEMILEIARYFADLTTFDDRRQRYAVRGVMGPDEFHTGYPGSPAPGVDNNAYTNVMVVWVLLRALDVLRVLTADRRQELRQTLGLAPDEERRWRSIARRMFVPFHNGLISQFEGYADLAELDWDAYRARYGDIRRLDRILEAEGDDPNRYRASKQADVLMLLYLFSADELRALLERLGYALPPEAVPRLVDYYLARTSHGSTLSAVVHAWVLARSRRAEALDYLAEALRSDVADVQGGTTAEGIHLAAMAGSIDLLQRCFAGVETRGDTLVLNPYWPPELGVLELDVRYRRHRLRLRISDAMVELSSAPGDHRPIRVQCRHETVTVPAGGSIRLSASPRMAA